MTNASLISTTDLRLLIYLVAFSCLIGFAASIVATERRRHEHDRQVRRYGVAPWLDPVEPPQRPMVTVLYDQDAEQ